MKNILKMTLMFGLLSSSAFGMLTPNLIQTASSKKTQNYLRDGIFTGGDRSIDQVVIKDIRRAKNAEGERVVIDLEGSLNGEPAAIERAPLYHVAVNHDENRSIITVSGRPRLGFDVQKVLSGFKKSSLVQGLELFPRVEPETWSFVLSHRGDLQIEVFELSDPVRIIFDLKSEIRKKVQTAAAAKAVHAPTRASTHSEPLQSEVRGEEVTSLPDAEREETHAETKHGH